MGQRATSIEDYKTRIARLLTEEGVRVAKSFQPRSTDIIIATYAKAGTTWTQQIAHGLRTKGDMDFSEITDVTPWIEMAHDAGWDLSGDQKAHPRLFKSHWSGEQVPSGCRYINVTRDPIDCVISFFNFMNGWIIEPGKVTPDEMADYLAHRDFPFGDCWTYLLTWWNRRHDDNVLLLFYEDMKHDLETNVRMIADFMGLGDDQTAIDIATRQASFEFMKAHESHFDDHSLALARNEAAGLPKDALSSKVKTGKIGSNRDILSPSTLAMLNAKWRDIVMPVTGHQSYADYRAALSRLSED